MNTWIGPISLLKDNWFSNILIISKFSVRLKYE